MTKEMEAQLVGDLVTVGAETLSGDMYDAYSAFHRQLVLGKYRDTTFFTCSNYVQMVVKYLDKHPNPKFYVIENQLENILELETFAFANYPQLRKVTDALAVARRRVNDAG